MSGSKGKWPRTIESRAAAANLIALQKELFSEDDVARQLRTNEEQCASAEREREGGEEKTY